jgi:hydrogenase expression/formation protein HypD
VSEAPELRDPKAIAGLIREIREVSEVVGRKVTLMEVCGTHTHAVAAAGLRQMLPPGVRLISGPGCPVCVTPVDYLDRALALADLDKTTVCTFGDLMRVPSSLSSLEQAHADGKPIEIVYSPRDALQIARDNPDQRVVFLAVGFETTAPTIAAALAEAETDGVGNFMILPGNKVMPPPMQVLVEDQELEVDGFLLPGHVSVLTGWECFRFLAEDYNVPGTVVGFAPADVMRGVVDLLRQVKDEKAEITNLYSRVVSPLGNQVAAEIVEQFFEPVATNWRGFGEIPDSGLGLRPQFAQHDASRIDVELPPPHEPEGCACGDVLRGVIDPPECSLFGTACLPATPVGACMVSSEGTCAAWYRHERLTGATT